ncbi:PAS domain-containing protein, partial [Rhodohalobacter sp.]|uniref:PAS domain-containing protein n=1 Tax=Rhodohalobacter sp. TaxID=1974210 RepID=UPI0035682253
MTQVTSVLKKLSQIESLLNNQHSGNGINTQIKSLVDDIRGTITPSVSSPDQNLYRLIFEKAPIGIVHFDEDGIVTACNSNFVKILDSSREKLIGFPMKKLPNKELVSNMIKALKGEEGVYEGRYKTITSDKTVYIRATFNQIDPSGGIAIVEDTTERYLAGQKIKESEHRFRSIFENKHSVMLIIDPENGQIVDANPAAINFYGWELGEIKKKKISEINTLSKEQVEREMERAKTNKSHLFHFKHRLSDGTIKDVEVFSGTIRIDEQILLFSVITDVSDRIKKDKDLLKFKLGIERSSNVVFITNTDGSIGYVNKAFTDLY